MIHNSNSHLLTFESSLPLMCLHGGFPRCAVGGVLPFGAVFTELFFIMYLGWAFEVVMAWVCTLQRSSLWQHQFYYLFGFLALVQYLGSVFVSFKTSVMQGMENSGKTLDFSVRCL